MRPIIQELATPSCVYNTTIDFWLDLHELCDVKAMINERANIE
jgi:hypothetical protein